MPLRSRDRSVVPSGRCVPRLNPLPCRGSAAHDVSRSRRLPGIAFDGHPIARNRRHASFDTKMQLCSYDP